MSLWIVPNALGDGRQTLAVGVQDQAILIELPAKRR